MIESGIYLHYKGSHYLVIGTVVDHHSRRTMVLYVPLYLVDGEQHMTVRDIADFKEKFRKVGVI